MPDNDLLARLDAPSAEAWRPEKEGETLIGEVVAVSERTTEYGTYPIVTVRRDDNGLIVAFHAMGTVAKNRVEEHQPRPRGRIAIRFDGERKSKTGATYKAWAMAYDPPAGVAERLAATPVKVELEEEEPF